MSSHFLAGYVVRMVHPIVGFGFEAGLRVVICVRGVVLDAVEEMRW